MDLIRILNSVGKSTFVKYYYYFRDKSRDACIAAFDEDYTDKAKSTRVGHAQRIFHENQNIAALKIIVASSRIDRVTLEKANEILKNETLGKMN